MVELLDIGTKLGCSEEDICMSSILVETDGCLLIDTEERERKKTEYKLYMKLKV